MRIQSQASHDGSSYLISPDVAFCIVLVWQMWESCTDKSHQQILSSADQKFLWLDREMPGDKFTLPNVKKKGWTDRESVNVNTVLLCLQGLIKAILHHIW